MGREAFIFTFDISVRATPATDNITTAAREITRAACKLLNVLRAHFPRLKDKPSDLQSTRFVYKIGCLDCNYSTMDRQTDRGTETEPWQQGLKNTEGRFVLETIIPQLRNSTRESIGP